MSSPVFVVDDDDLVLSTISTLLESFGMATESLPSAEALLERTPLPAGSCVVTDVRMPGMNGLNLLETLRERGETAPVVVLTAHADVDIAVAAFRKGADDFLTKPFSNTELVEIVQRALRRAGERAERTRTAETARARLSGLSQRELEVARLLVQGRSNKAAALELGISYRTVEHHRRHVMEKTECASLVELDALLRQAGEGGAAEG
ncbi:MAG: response regulator transcription factor [Pseudomonadota bacterium]